MRGLGTSATQLGGTRATVLPDSSSQLNGMGSYGSSLKFLKWFMMPRKDQVFLKRLIFGLPRDYEPLTFDKTWSSRNILIRDCMLDILANKKRHELSVTAIALTHRIKFGFDEVTLLVSLDACGHLGTSRIFLASKSFTSTSDCGNTAFLVMHSHARRVRCACCAIKVLQFGDGSDAQKQDNVIIEASSFYELKIVVSRIVEKSHH